jgi:hypothetical protein
MTNRRERRRSERDRADPYAVLGVPHDASADQIRRARNRLARRLHPDMGGSHHEMQRVNDAAAVALASARSAPASHGHEEAAPTRPGAPAVRRDHPSFTIEALPVEAFEALLLAASAIGRIDHDEPPYRLEVSLGWSDEVWCILDLVPDGGGSTVSLTISSARRPDGPSVVGVRDLLVDELNRLDWGPEGPQRPPC